MASGRAINWSHNKAQQAVKIRVSQKLLLLVFMITVTQRSTFRSTTNSELPHRQSVPRLCAATQPLIGAVAQP
jgi:hypothetical protein